ncbi:DNA translocase FtsK [Zhongshania aliphaticivorans]|uniref:DNA translocase FtsK n=1 Tax=Zhongshania aliphaticivorans TaxID=1470434 RepID=A0A5S9NEP6_9GAMM|nr:DNA translocase FtsK [Zhongshania aliphaticivorans]CAA0088803.1 DNA translocase FtsK [Zhongshania aliphaticivorans]CAA0095176.1 DNA translocase FtsK [Zhongshania aliphaticivorans]
MPKSTKKPAANNREILHLRLREGLLIGFVAVCIYIFVSLISYSGSDPGWSRTGSGDGVVNAGGPVGAWLADVFFALFGYMAYLFPSMLAFRAWRLFKSRYRPVGFDSLVFSLRVIGLILVMISSTGLATNGDYGNSGLPFGAGGVLGDAIGHATLASFNEFGSRLILIAILLFGLTVFTDLSWIKLMDSVGAITLSLYERAGEAWYHYRQARAERRKAALAAKERHEAFTTKTEIQKTRVPPQIAPPPKPIAKSSRPEKERQTSLFDGPVTGTLPSLSLLDKAVHNPERGFSPETLEAMSRLLEIKLLDFGVSAKVVAVFPGPVITRFELEPDAGVKVSKISNLVKDLARSLAVVSVRVVEVIPGKPYVGIEIPNEDREIVNFHDVLSSEVFDSSKSPLTLALGHDISGEPVCADLGKMPHLLVAGTTGSGKSVGVNAMLISLLYKSTPEEVRLMLVDPKMLELSVYDGIPHLLTPVITDMKDAANGLRWCVAEMERRYQLMSKMGVRNLAGFNRKVKDAIQAGEPLKDPLWKPEEHYQAGLEEAQPPDLEVLPSIVVVIDEFADMMMIVGKKVEELIARIAQKARAAGIHLLLATQRPSVDVITGLIKANVPTRIGFQVSSKIDSRTILDQGGAEQLLGHGDMLYLPPGAGIPIRVHGAFVSDEEVHRVVADWKRRGDPQYIDGLLEEGSTTDAMPGMAPEGGDNGEGDALYDEAVQYVTESRRASISSVQRKLRIGYNRAARLIETMEAAGVVTEMASNGSREVLAPPPRD